MTPRASVSVRLSSRGDCRRSYTPAAQVPSTFSESAATTTTGNDMETDTETNVLADLAREACERHTEPEKAAKYVRRKIEADAELKESLLDQLIWMAVQEAVYRQRRLTFKTIKAQHCSRGIEAIAAAGQSVVRSLLNEWPMPWGGTLGDAYGKQLIPLSESESEEARGHQRLATWYRSIADRVGPESRVREKLSEDQVSELLRQASAAGQYIPGNRVNGARPGASNNGGNGQVETANQVPHARPAANKKHHNGHRMNDLPAGAAAVVPLAAKGVQS